MNHGSNFAEAFKGNLFTTACDYNLTTGPNLQLRFMGSVFQPMRGWMYCLLSNSILIYVENFDS